MTSLAERVLATIRRRRLFRPGSRILAAVSGGPDSVALLYVLSELAARDVLVLAGLAHLDHRLRGDASARDAVFCEALARRLGIDAYIGVEDVAERRKETGGSIEAVAREVRYAFLERQRVRAGADLVAVGHTRDDQAETVLLRLVRGAGVRGMAGILPRAGTVVRPLFDVSRGEVLDYLAQQRLDYVVDETNADLSLARSRMRHVILPELTRQFGPSVPAALARHADAARDDERLLASLAVESASAIVRQRGRTAEVQVEGLRSQPPALARRIVRSAVEGLGAPSPALRHLDAALALVASGSAGALALPGCTLELCPAEGVLLIRRGRVARPSGPGAWRHDLPVPGEVDLPEAGLRCRAERRAGWGAESGLPGGWSVAVAGAGVGERLVVRAWQPGDRLQPLGLNGRKKVQDLFVDRKVPRDERRRVPIVTDETDRIIWVAGHALAEPFRVTPATKSVVVLSFEPLGGPA